MIKKYTALCLIISSLTIYTAEKKPTETTFVISSKKTAWFQSLETRFNIIMEKQQQEHTTQQQQMKQEHEENLKKLSQIFIARVQENDVIFTKQFDDNQKKIEEQAKNVQETFNSSTQYQLAELNLENTKSDLALHEKRRERIELGRKVLYGATPALPIASIIAGYQNQSLTLGGCLTLFSGLLLRAGYHYITDSSTLIEHEITKSQNSIEKLETILVKFKPTATEDPKEESEDLKDNV